jgi:CBS domain-containing protein
MSALKQHWNDFQNKINSCFSTQQLREIRNAFHASIDTDLLTKHTTEYFTLVNQMHDLLIQRTIFVAEEQVKETWRSFPVSSFAFVMYGSGGRKEQTLWSDQDNGMIFQEHEGADPEEIQSFTHHFGSIVKQLLEEVGYPPCEGNVLISNAAWRNSVISWKQTYRNCFEQPTFESVRHLLINADARVIYGNTDFVSELHEEMKRRVIEHPSILERMLSNTLRYKVLVGFLGNLLTEPYGEDAGGIDIKYGAYIPMVSAIRLLSIHRGIPNTSTLERIDQLSGMLGITSADTKLWGDAFLTILKFRAMTPYQMDDGKYTTRGILTPDLLTKDVKRELKHALRIGADLQKLVKRTIRTEVPS